LLPADDVVAVHVDALGVGAHLRDQVCPALMDLLAGLPDEAAQAVREQLEQLATRIEAQVCCALMSYYLQRLNTYLR
jgi:hypothetical protein